MLFNMRTGIAYYVRKHEQNVPPTYSILTEAILARGQMEYYSLTVNDLRAALANEGPNRWLEYIRGLMTNDNLGQEVMALDLQGFLRENPDEVVGAVPDQPVMSPTGTQPGGDAFME